MSTLNKVDSSKKNLAISPNGNPNVDSTNLQKTQDKVVFEDDNLLEIHDEESKQPSFIQRSNMETPMKASLLTSAQAPRQATSSLRNVSYNNDSKKNLRHVVPFDDKETGYETKSLMVGPPSTDSVPTVQITKQPDRIGMSQLKIFGQQQQQQQQTQQSLPFDWLSWGKSIGKKSKQQSEQDYIKEALEDNGIEIYPLSVRITPPQKRKIIFFRFLALFLCFVALIPYDLWNPTSTRTGYYATAIKHSTIKFQSMPSVGYQFLLTNCKVFLYPKLDANDSMSIEYGYKFYTRNYRTYGRLSIYADATQSCIVNLYLPPDVALPQLTFNYSGTMDNILFDDSNLNGTQLNFAKGLNIYGDAVFITLNNHKIPTFNANIKFAVLTLTNITSTKKVVVIQQGIYNEHLPKTDKIHLTNVQQRQAHICLYGAQIQQSAKVNGTRCPFVDKNITQCQVESYICYDNVTTCNASASTKIPSITVTNIDGPVQIAYDYDNETLDQNLTTQKPGNFTKIDFTIGSKAALNISQILYYNDIVNDRVSVLQTIGVDYKKSWVYTNRLHFLQSQYWSLVWASGTLLRPKVEYKKVVFSDYQCPARTNSLSMDIDINDHYFSYFPQTTMSAVAFVVGYSNFYLMAVNEFGTYSYYKILFGDNNLMIAAFGVAGAIAIVGSLFFLRLTYVFTKYVRQEYNKFLINQMHLAITKRQTQATGRAAKNISEGSIKFELESKQKLLETRGIVRTGFIKYDPLISIGVNKQKRYNFILSVFQIPTLYIDFITRKKLDSVDAFLRSIEVDASQFPPKKMKQQQKRKKLSMLLSEFQKEYSSFCQKNGYQERDAEKDGFKALNTYDLQIENTAGSMKPGYVNIRFRTAKEKSNRNDYDENSSQQQTDSTILKFLRSECIYSSFTSDQLSFEDLKKAYSSYCRLQGIIQSNQEQIIGSDELEQFGAKVAFIMPPKILVGIMRSTKELRFDGDKPNALVRRPCKTSSKDIVSLFTAADGLVPNFIIAVIHFLMIAAVPLLLPGITFTAIFEMTTLQEDMFKKVMTMNDFYNANRLDPWWQSVPYITQVLYIHAYVLFFLLVAYLELISFYLTGFDNNGRFPTRLSIPRKILVNLLYATLTIFLFMYYAMAWLVIVWAVLGAILNPSKFLPYATAAITLFAVISAKIALSQLKYLNIVKRFEAMVAATISGVIVKNMKKNQKKQQNKGSAPIGEDQTVKIKRQLSKYLDLGEGGTFLQISDIKTQDDLNRVAARALHELQPIMVQLCTAVALKDKERFFLRLKEVATELQMNGQILEGISTVALIDYNPTMATSKTLIGQIEYQTKKLFEIIFPGINLDMYGILLQVALLGDTKPIIEILEYYQKESKEEFILEFEIMNHAIFKNKQKLEQGLFKFVDKIMGDKYDDLHFVYENLCKLSKGDLTGIIAEQSYLNPTKSIIAQKMKFKYNFPIATIVSFSQRSLAQSKLALTQMIKELMAAKDVLTPLEKENAVTCFKKNTQKFNHSERLFLALQSIIKGKQLDIKNICSVAEFKDDEIIEIIHGCSLNSAWSFEYILCKLDCSAQQDILLEFYSIMLNKNLDIFEICRKLKIPEQKSQLLFKLIFMLYNILKYQILKNQLDEEREANKRQKLIIDIAILRQDVDSIIQIIEDDIDHKIFKDFDWMKDNTDARDLHTSLQVAMTFNMDKLVKISSDTQLNETEIMMNEAKINEEKRQRQKAKLLKQIFTVKNKTFARRASFFGGMLKKQQHSVNNCMELWDLILNIPQIKQIFGMEVNKDALLIIKCHAFALLRNSQLIDQKDNFYIECRRKLSDFYEIPEDKFEFLIDLIGGNPLDIFKAMPKKPIYTISSKSEECEIKVDFDQIRAGVVGSLLNCTQKELSQLCLHWYHQHRMYYKGIGYQTYFMKVFGFKSEFMDIIKLRRNMIQAEDNNYFHKNEYLDSIRYFLKKKIGVKLNQRFKEHVVDNPTTDQYFINQDNELIDLQNVPDEQLISEEQTLEKHDRVSLLNTLYQLIDFKFTLESIIIARQPAEKRNYKLFQEQNKRFLTIVQSILSTSQDYTAENILQTLKILSQNVDIFAKQETWEHSSDLSLDDQNLFIQFNLLINASKLDSHFGNEDTNKIQLLKILNYFIDIANQSRILPRRKMQVILPIMEEDLDTIIQSLYENGYFKDIATRLIPALLGRQVPAKKCNIYLGILIGSALNDKNVLRTSIMDLLHGEEMQLNILNGLAAIVMQDTNPQDHIKQFCKQLELDDNLIIDIIDLMTNNQSTLPSVLINLLMTNTPEHNKTCSNFLQILQGEISMIKPLAPKISVDPNTIIPVLACATGNFDVIEEHYQFLLDKIGIGNQKVIKYILNLSHGKTQCIYELSEKRSHNFKLYSPDLSEALYCVTYTGRRIVEHYKKLEEFEDIGSIENSIFLISEKIKDICGIQDKENSVNNLNNSVALLVKACWKDKISLTTLLKKLRKCTTNSIWNEGKHDPNNPYKLANLSESNQIKFLKKCLQQIAQEKIDITDAITQKQRELISMLNGDILPDLLRVYTNSSPNNKDFMQKVDEFAKGVSYIIDNSIINGLKTDAQKMSYKLGCTYGIGLDKKISQPFFYCTTCNAEQNDEGLGICLICATMCHAGHQLVPGAYGRSIKMVCDCGSGKFTKCTKLNENNPCEMLRYERSKCSMIREDFKQIQRQQLEEFNKKDNIIRIDAANFENKYTTTRFLCDVAVSLQLEEYFCQELKLQLRKQQGSEDFFTDQNGFECIKDSQTMRSYTLVQNLIFMASGSITNSFLSILTAYKEYKFEDFLAQTLYLKNGQNGRGIESKITQQQTLLCLLSIAQGEPHKFEQYAEGFCQVMGEVGSKEKQAADRLSELIRLARGDILPAENETKMNSYTRFFQQLYGLKWKSVIILHYLLTVSKKELWDIMDFNKKNEKRKEIMNVKAWTDAHLFKNFLQVDDVSRKHCQSIFGLQVKNEDSLNYLAKMREIPLTKVKLYKALLFQPDDINMNPIFQNLSQMIPIEFNIDLLRIWHNDRNAVMHFIYRFAKGKSIKKWKSQQELGMKVDANGLAIVSTLNQTILEEQELKSQKGLLMPLKSLYKQMNGELSKMKYAEVLQDKLLDTMVIKDDSCKQQIKRISSVYYAFQGLCKNDIRQVASICDYFTKLGNESESFADFSLYRGNESSQQNTSINRPDTSKPLIEKKLLMSLIKLQNKTWEEPDLDLIVDSLNQGRFANKPEIKVFFPHLIQALEGDLVSLGKIMDEVIKEGNSHFYSLIAAIITGKTKYDSSSSLTNNQKDPFGNTARFNGKKNILKRELYRLFETITRNDLEQRNVPVDIINNYLSEAFNQKAPLHVLLLLTEDRNFVDKVFKMNEEFRMNMIGVNDINQATKEHSLFMQNLVNFLTPQHITSPIRPLLQFILPEELCPQEILVPKLKSIPILNPFNNIIKLIGIQLRQKINEDTNETTKYKTFDLLQLFYNCFSLDPTALNLLYFQFVRKFDNVSLFALLLELQKKVLDGQRSMNTENLYSVITLIQIIGLWEKKKIYQALKDKLFLPINANKMNNIVSIYDLDIIEQDVQMAHQITLWTEGIMIMLGIECKEQDKKMYKFKQIIQGYYDFYTSPQPPQPNQPSLEQQNPFKLPKEKINYIIDIIVGLINLCKEDYGNIKQLTVKRGSFVEPKKITGFYKIVSFNIPYFNQAALPPPPPVMPKTPQIDLENFNILDSKKIYDYFTSSSGPIGFEEFQTIVNHMGLKLSQSQMLQCFSTADADNSGILNPNEFSVAINELKSLLVYETVEKTGYSAHDFVISIIFGVLILLMMFVFIFIGIEAFAPASAFSSVVNSSLPMAAGGVTSKGNTSNVSQRSVDSAKNSVQGNFASKR